jgi:predicted RNA-binding Zn ribbon-like protein
VTPTSRLWDWLGEPLPIDFANTVRREGSGYRELLRSGDDLARWSGLERGRVPAIDPVAAGRRLDEVRAVRDDVFALLGAAAAGTPFPPDARQRLNDRARAHPLVPQLGPRAGQAAPPFAPAGASPVDALLIRVAHATIDLLSAEGAGGVALCDAPSCGQFFVRDRPNRHWCGHACGTRARVARHAGQPVAPYTPPVPASSLT